MAALNKAKKILIEDDGKPLDLDATMGKPKNRVALVGVELEGGWKVQPAGMAIVRDGSVFKDGGDDGALKRDQFPDHKCGELPIGPFQVAQIAKAMRQCWPDIVDKSCGLHIHQSFNSLFHYMLLADSASYQETICKYLAIWAKEEGFDAKHDIWNRLSGKSAYCQKEFWPQAQMTRAAKDHDQARHGHRYTVVNYCFERFSTVEIRVLPMMTSVEQGIRGVKRVIDITNAYLLKTEKSKLKEHGKIKLSTEGTNIKLELRKGSVYEEFYED